MRDKALNVLDRRAFADLVHRCVGQAEVDHRAELNEEAAVGSAAAGREFRLRSGFFLDRLDHHVVERPGGVRNASPEMRARTSRPALRARRFPRPAERGRRPAADC